MGELSYKDQTIEGRHTSLNGVELIASVMGLKARFIEYFSYNINTYPDLEEFKEEIAKLLGKQFSVSVQITAHGFNSSDFGSISQNNLETKVSSSFFNPSFSTLDYNNENGAGSKHGC